MFSFEPSLSNPVNIDGVDYEKARIVIDEYEEDLLIPLSYWSLDIYQSYWKAKLNQFFHDDLEKVFLITEMYDPEYANFIRGWVVYRKNENVVLQERILFIGYLGQAQ